MIVFQKSGLSDLTFENGRAYPLISPVEFNQEIYETEDRSVKVVDYGGTPVEYIQINLPGMNQKEALGLLAWFKSSQVNGAANNFTVINENGESQTVRLWQTQIEIEQDGFGIYNASLTLRKE
ncbi:MAG: hypothetical protein ONB55_21760 [candidate division KSB1 bacterium]|nr:hypothetical protein [candidate division KSB1 bacterium]